MTVVTLKPTIYSFPSNLKPPASLLKPVLVLNRNWQPINVATVARALIMLWNDSAKIVDPIDYQLYDWSDWSQLVPDRDEPFSSNRCANAFASQKSSR